jgi:SulP family sulfate permease
MTLGVGLVTLAIIILTPKISKRLPGALVAIILVTIAVYLLNINGIGTNIETIGMRFGELKAEMPKLQTFSLNIDRINELLPSAFTIAMLGAIESLLSATVADGITGSRTSTNTELIGQGLANIAVPFIGGIPVTGAIARTMTNITNGGRTPVAGIIHAVVLLLIYIFLMPLICLVPMACLAAVLMVVAYNMSGWRTIVGLFKSPKSDVSVLVVTFLLTVILDLTIAIEIGLLLAVVLFMRRVMENTQIKVYSKQLDVAEDTDLDDSHHEVLDVLPGIEVYEIDGPFFFGIATKFDEMMRATIGERPKVRILRMRKVPFIDSTAIHNLEILIKSSEDAGIHVVLSGVRDSVRQTLVKAGIERLISDDHICDHISKAVVMANSIVRANPA